MRGQLQISPEMISDNAIKWNLDTFQSERCQDNFKKVWPKLFLLILLRPCHSTPTHGEWDILICTYFSYLGRYTIIYNTYNILVHILLVFPFPNHRWKWMLVLGKVISCCVFEIPRWLVTLEAPEICRHWKAKQKPIFPLNSFKEFNKLDAFFIS